jgi:hypothetical protein
MRIDQYPPMYFTILEGVGEKEQEFRYILPYKDAVKAKMSFYGFISMLRRRLRDAGPSPVGDDARLPLWNAQADQVTVLVLGTSTDATVTLAFRHRKKSWVAQLLAQPEVLEPSNVPLPHTPEADLEARLLSLTQQQKEQKHD